MTPETHGILLDSPATADEAASDALRLAGFWRRFLALLVDVLLLGVVGWALGNGLADFFIARPLLALMVGTALALAYGALLEGPLGRGQTLGKKLLGIKVVGADAGVVSPASAWLRAVVKNLLLVSGLVLGLLQAIGLPEVAAAPSALVLALVFVLAVAPGLLDFYCYLTDGRGRQSLHDRLARTWVVRGDNRVQPVARPLWKGHFIVVSLLLAGLAAGFYGFWRFATNALRDAGGFDFQAMATAQEDLQRLVDAHPEWPVQSVGVSGTPGTPPAGSVPGKPGPQRPATIALQVMTRTKAPPANHAAISRALARRFLAVHPELRAREGRLLVTYGYAFSLGIYSQSWITLIDTLPLSKWSTDAPPDTEHPFDH